MSHETFALTLLRFAERMFDEATCQRIVVPALADVRHECASAPDATWRRRTVCLRAYWGAFKAIAICLIRDVALDRQRVGRTLAGQMALFTIVLIVLLSIPWWGWALSFGTTYGARKAIEAGVWLLPTAVIMALPGALFFAVALQRRRDRAPLGPTVLGGAAICTAVVFALLMFAGPEANQAYRSVVFKAFFTRSGEVPPALRRGLSEMSLPMLNDHIAHAPSTREAGLARAHRQQRFAYVALVPVMALLGLALAGRWRSRALTFGAALAIFVTYGITFGLGADGRGNPSLYGPWTANVLYFALAVRLLRTPPDLQTPSA